MLQFSPQNGFEITI